MRVDNELVVITRYDSNFCVNLMNNLLSHKVSPGLIVIQNTTIRQRIKMAKFLSKKIGIFDALRYNLIFLAPLIKRAISFGLWSKLPNFKCYEHSELIFCKNINDLDIVKKLQDSKYKKIILAQSGIVRDDILSLKDKWIINAHPGDLPAYRGVDVVKWALLNGRPIVATLHIVCKGVDTGDILKSQVVPINPEDSINDIEIKANVVCIELLTEAALRGPDKYLVKIHQNVDEGKQYYLMPFNILKHLNRKWSEKRDPYEKEKTD